MDRDKYYFCYSQNLMKFLKDNNEEWICIGVNDKTNRKYWLFEKTDSLKKLLGIFTEKKQKFLNKINNN